MTTRLILFAHGSADMQWKASVERLAEPLRDRLGTEGVDVAYLERLEPTLVDAVGAAVSAGIEHVKVLPLFLASGAHINRDLAALGDEIRRRYPALQLDVLPPIGEDSRFAGLVLSVGAEAVARA